LQQWFPRATITNSVATGRSMYVDTAWREKNALLEFVCHERAGPESEVGSVAEHLGRLVEVYGQHLPDFPELWLINYDTKAEYSGSGQRAVKYEKETILSAAVKCNRMQVFVEVEPELKIAGMMVWRKGHTKPEHIPGWKLL
jgi:hypothetical protein